jgi:hypothetical protein
MIYMHLLTWVGFGLLGYVPNKLYISISIAQGDISENIRYSDNIRSKYPFMIVNVSRRNELNIDLVLIDQQSVGKRISNGHCQCEKEMDVYCHVNKFLKKAKW